MNNFQGLSKSHGNENVTYDRISKPVYIVDTVFYIGKEAESWEKLSWVGWVGPIWQIIIHFLPPFFRLKAAVRTKKTAAL